MDVVLQGIGDALGPRKILLVREPRVGLEGVVVVDNLACGPAIGGVRMAPDVSLEEVMTKDPATIPPDEPLRRATELMRARGIRHLPVTDEGGRVLGMGCRSTWTRAFRGARRSSFRPGITTRWSGCPTGSSPGW